MIRVRALLLAALCLVLAGASAQAQTKYPSKPVRIIVPYAAGGATDITTRIVAEHLRAALGESFVVENKPGASGIVAIEEMARSRPDGHTLMVGNISTNGLTPLLFAKKMKIDYQKDVTIVTRVADLRSTFIATTTNFPPNSVTELIAYAKQRPGKVMFASAGIGSIQQFDYGLLMKRTGIELTHIPFKGGGADMTRDMAKGDVHLAVGPYAASRALIRSGQLKALAVVGDKPLDELPGVQTMAQAGFPDVGSDHWQVMFAPAGTPREILDTLHKAIADAVQAPGVLEAFARSTIFAPPRLTREQSIAWMRDEFAKWRKIIDELKIEVED